MSTLSIFLNNVLEKYDSAQTDGERKDLSIVLDEVYSFEKTNALRSSARKNKSIGFDYLVDNHKDHERNIEFFSSRMINEVLREKSNAEERLHKRYSTYKEFMDDDPNGLLCEIISEHDTDLADFVRTNMGHIRALTEYTDSIRDEWEWKEEFGKIMEQLDSCYVSIEGKELSKQEIYTFLFKNNGLLEDFKKYCSMDSEEVDRMVKEDSIFGKLRSITNIKSISEMDRIIKSAVVKRQSKKGERLILKED